MARWIAILLAGCAETIGSDCRSPLPVEEPATEARAPIEEGCPLAGAGPHNQD